MHSHHQHTVILYHAKCPDGFGGAYAAWKKYGDIAEYIPVKYGGEVPEKMEGREIIFVDFCFPQEQMEALRRIAESVTVLDHHEGVRAVATTFPGVFDTERSGATIAWSYFHPHTPTPRLMYYLEDGDMYRYAMPETEMVFAYLVVQPDDFELWDRFAHALEDDNERPALLAKASAYQEYFEKMTHLLVESAKKVRFEGFECYFSTSFPSITMRSHAAHELYTKLPPIALVVSAHPDGFGVSIRGDGSVDVSKIAEKYGGNGHATSSGFFIPASANLPWEEIKD